MLWTVGLLALIGSAVCSDGTHWIVLPSTISPGTSLPVTFSFFNTTDDVKVQVDLMDGSHMIQSINHTFTQAQSGMISIQVPDNLVQKSTYKVIIHGLSGAHFTEQATLKYNSGKKAEKFAIFLQTDKLMYKPGQTVRFRAFGLFSNMSVYTGPLDVAIFDPNYNKIKQWGNLTNPEFGVIENHMLMDSEPLLGDWFIEVKNHQYGVTEKKAITIGKYSENTDFCTNSTSAVDILFILDASGSIGSSNFQTMLKFVEETVNIFPVSRRATQIAVMTFESSVYSQFNYDKYFDKHDLESAISKIRYTSGGTQTDRALKFARETMMKPQNGQRPGATQIAIVVTDGQSNSPSATAQEAAVFKSTGVTVFAIGVGSGVNAQELKTIASDPSTTHVFQVTNFQSLTSIKETLAKRTCTALPKFDVALELPHYVLTSDTSVTGTVRSVYTYGKPVSGKVKVKADLDYYYAPWRYHGTGQVMVETTLNTTGESHFTIPLDRIKTELDAKANVPLYQKLNGYHLTIDVEVIEKLNNWTRSATDSITFYDVPYSLKFDSAKTAKYFKPGLPYTAFVSLTQPDGRPIGSQASSVDASLYTSDSSVGSTENKTWTRVVTLPATGSFELKAMPSSTSRALRFEVHYKGKTATWTASKPSWADHHESILLKKKTDALTGHNADFELMSAHPLEQVFYTVVANKIVTHAGSVTGSGTNTTVQVSFPVTDKMKPYSQLIVYYFDSSSGNWSADSIYFNVDEGVDMFKNKVNLGFDRTKAEPGQNISLQITTDPKSLVNVLAVDQSVSLIGTDNDISQEDVKSSSLRPETAPTGTAYDKLHNPETVLQVSSDIQVLSDVVGFMPTPPPRPTFPSWSSAGSCQDRIPNCAAYGQNVCSNPRYDVWVRDNCVRYCGYCMGFSGGGGGGFLMSRPHINSASHLASGGLSSGTGFAGSSIGSALTGSVGTGTALFPGLAPTASPSFGNMGLSTRAPLPTTKPSQSFSGSLHKVVRTRTVFPETWVWTKVVSGADGHVNIDATVPDTITSWVASAFSVNKVSGLGISASHAKFTSFRPFFVSLNLPYSVVRGEEVVLQATVYNYLSQDMDVVVTLDNSTQFMAIVPQGTTGQVQYISQKMIKQIKVPAGKSKSAFIPIVPAELGKIDISVKAQSLLAADGVRRQLLVEPEGVLMEYNVPNIVSNGSVLDIPLKFPALLVADSKKLRVSAIGDLMGPTLNNLNSLLRLPTGCGEQTMTNLAPDVFVVNYLKITRQLTNSLKNMAVGYMEKGYQRELNFQRYDGSFSIWGDRDSVGSMWLTAFVAKSFHQAKPYIYVSEEVLGDAIDWILKHQNTDGSFRAEGSVHSTMLKGGSSVGYSLTSFVLIALLENSDTNHPGLTSGVAKARTYLESHVNDLHSMYDLAIVSYALKLAGSSQASVVYAKLDQMATVKDGMKYWTPTPVVVRPMHWYDFYCIRQPPVSVETTAYALLYNVHAGAVSTESLKILKWLVSQRNERGAFSSTQDTVIALQAMSEYKSITGDMNLNINTNVGNFSHQFHIQSQDALVLKTTEVPASSVPDTNASVHIEATGKGSAMAQVHVSFHVEQEEIPPSFDVSVNVTNETMSAIVVQSCFKSMKGNTGMSVVEFGVPTGFEVDLESSNTVTDQVKKTEVKERMVVLYYDQIPNTNYVCATLEMVRMDMVAKSKPAAVRVYDYYEPNNRALTFFESQLLKNSNYCDVCTECGCHQTVSGK